MIIILMKIKPLNEYKLLTSYLFSNYMIDIKSGNRHYTFLSVIVYAMPTFTYCYSREIIQPEKYTAVGNEM